MGLFSGRVNAVIYSHPGEVSVDLDVAKQLTDPGRYLVNLLSDLPSERLQEVEQEIERVRHPNGGLPSALRSNIESSPKAGPLYLLDWISVVEDISFNVWSTYTLKGKSKQSMLEVCMDVLRHQGAPAAATWTISQRGAEVLNVDFLNQQLRKGYDEWAGKITNKMVIDCFNKWRR